MWLEIFRIYITEWINNCGLVCCVQFVRISKAGFGGGEIVPSGFSSWPWSMMVHFTWVGLAPIYGMAAPFPSSFAPNICLLLPMILIQNLIEQPIIVQNWLKTELGDVNQNIRPLSCVHYCFLHNCWSLYPNIYQVFYINQCLLSFLLIQPTPACPHSHLTCR